MAQRIANFLRSGVMQFLRWYFLILIIVTGGLLFLAGKYNRHPAVTAATITRNHQLAEAHHSPGVIRRQSEEAQPEACLVFPHVGDGILAGTDRFMQSTLILVNTTRRPNAGHIHFYDDEGFPLEVTIDGITSSRFDFEMNPTEVGRWVTSGQGELVSGWAEVYSVQPLTGTLTFGIRDTENTVNTDVGVAPATTGKEFTMFADSVSWANTGVALSNPSANNSIQVILELRDLAGNTITHESIDLPPMGHRARFMTEIFSSVEGIRDFEGSIVIESEAEFAAITLRTWGQLLTSMPMVVPIPEDAEWTRLAFPHVGDGRAGGLMISTAVILFNNGSQSVSGHVDFYRSDATGMDLSIGSSTGSTFDFDLAPGQVTRLSTIPGQELQTGWAEVVADGPLNGTALYTIFDNVSHLLSEVGVEAAYLYQNFDLIADSLGSFNTGIAVANPYPDQAIDVRYELSYKFGGFAWGVTRTLEPLSHEALFITELFPNEETIDEFDGILRVSASTAGGWDGAWIAPVCLRQAGTKLTSLPILNPQYGFAPTAQIEFSQTLSGTTPAVYWSLSQRPGEFTVKKIRVSSSSLLLNTETLEPGLWFARGYALGSQGDQILDLISEVDDKTRFSIYNYDRETRQRWAQGRFLKQPEGGTIFELEFLDPTAQSITGTDASVGLTLPAGLFEVPEGVTSLSIITEFISVSIQDDQDQSLLRRLDEQFYFSQPSEIYANVTGIEPTFLKRGSRCVVRGSNFGDSPKFYIRTLDGRQSIEPYNSSDNEAEFVVPFEILDREIQIETSGGGRSNRLTPRFGFSPTATLELFEKAPAEYELRLSIGQSLRSPQPRASRFFLRLFDVDCEFSELKIDQDVGYVDRDHGGETGGYSGYRLVVAEVDENSAMLNLAPSYDPEQVRGTLSVTRLEENELLFEFLPAADWDRLDVAYFLQWKWHLEDLPILFSDPTALQQGILETQSYPLQEGGEFTEQYMAFVASSQP